ncbi:MAG: insulinase family protein [Eubacteriales bacterium]|nr:insulinase family protein [Eubacteriales bacterium]
MQQFEKIRQGRLESIPAEYTEYRHKICGTPVLFLKTEEKNKSFAIQFRTLPYSDNGVCHVLEHSVLSGSEKYDVKEPFVELLKGSLNTFLNAMTFPDKTVYPFATTNEQELLNLMDIYLDGVFFPRIYQNEDILRQEGHHLELDESGNLQIVGVVYNEMKGVMAQPEQRLMQSLQSELFDNVYSHNSGGEPEAVASLTQAELLSFHRKYYHPSNATVMVVGKVDEAAVLAKLAEYLDRFEAAEIDTEVKPTPAFTEIKKVSGKYAVSHKEEGQAIFGLAFAQGRYDQLLDNLGLKILNNILFMMESSPVRNTLLESGLVKDLATNFEDSLVQPMTSIMFRGLVEDDVDMIREALFFEFERLAEEGISEELKLAALNQWRFALKEGLDGGFMPQGLIYALDGLAHWDRGLDPLKKLSYNELLDELEKRMAEGYLEDLLRREFIQNKHCVEVLLSASENLLSQKLEAEEAELKARLAAMSEAELKELKRIQQELRERQSQADDPEKLAAIPVLSVEDLDPEVEALDYELVESAQFPGQRIIQINAADDGVTYLQLAFPLPELSLREWRNLNFLTMCLGALDTKNYKFSDLANRLMIDTGGIFVSPVIYEEKEGVRAYVQLAIKALSEQLPKAIELATELIYESSFADVERLGNLLYMQLSNAEMAIIEQADRVANDRLASYFSQKAALEDELYGLEAFRQGRAIAEQFPSSLESFKAELEALYKKLFRSEELQIAYRGHAREACLEQLSQLLKPYLGQVAASGRELPEFKEEAKNEAFIIPSEVSFIAQGYNLKKLGHRVTGQMLLAQKIIETDYLWEQVRVFGGAYGCNLRIGRDGHLAFVSYRDPKVLSTLKAYQGVPEYLEKVAQRVDSLDKFIISTIGQLDRPLSAAQEADRVVRAVHEGLTEAERQKLRAEILNAKLEEIAALGPIFKEVLEQNMICAFGSSRLITEGGEVFTETKI